MKVIVVGAGALGASVARALSRRAGVGVEIIDVRGVAGGTTALGAGIVSEVTWDSTNVKLIQDSARTLNEAGLFERAPSVTLVAERDVEAARARAQKVREAGGDAVYESVDKLERRPEFEDLRFAGVAGGIVAGRDGVASPPAWAAFALNEALDAGAALRREEVARLESSAVRLRSGERVGADAIVLAGGLWTAGLLAGSGFPIPLRPYRTQAAIFQLANAAAHGMPRGDGAPRHPRAGVPIVHDAAQGFYFRPHPEGILAGDGTDLAPQRVPAQVERGAEAAPDPGFQKAQAGRLAARLKGVGAPARAWAGLEAGTPDRHPLAGPDPRCEGLWLLAGGNGFGFMRSPALGAALAAAVLGEESAIAIDAFAPARFGGSWEKEFALAEGFTL